MKIKRIDSASNSIYKDLALLLTSKGIQKQKKTLISGEKILQEKLTKIPTDSFFIYHSETHSLFEQAPHLQCLVLAKDLFKTLDVVGTNAPLICKSIDALKNWEPPNGPPQEHQVLCALGDPSNLGAVIRSAYAFGFRQMILLEECANPYLPKVTKAASGYNLDMAFEKGPSIQSLPKNFDLAKSYLAALDMNGTSIHSWDFSKPLFWLMGEEGLGVPNTLQCQKVSIPMDNGVESLNAATTASILFYEIHSQLKKR